MDRACALLLNLSYAFNPLSHQRVDSDPLDPLRNPSHPPQALCSSHEITSKRTFHLLYVIQNEAAPTNFSARRLVTRLRTSALSTRGSAAMRFDGAALTSRWTSIHSESVVNALSTIRTHATKALTLMPEAYHRHDPGVPGEIHSRRLPSIAQAGHVRSPT